MLLRERSPSAHIATGMTIPLLAASGDTFESVINKDK